MRLGTYDLVQTMKKDLACQLAADETPRWHATALKKVGSRAESGTLCVTQGRLLFAYIQRPQRSPRPAWSTPLNQVGSIDVAKVGSLFKGGGSRRQLRVTLRTGETETFSLPFHNLDSLAQKLRDLLGNRT